MTHKFRRPDKYRISIAELRKRFVYDKKNGGLIRNPGVRMKHKTGSVKTTGYQFVRITHDGSTKDYSMQSLVFAWHHGRWAKEIDHLDNDKLNNRIQNLRECTRSENQLKIPNAGQWFRKPVIRSDGKKYISVRHAALDVMISQSCVSAVLRGKGKTAAGYGWRYA